MAKISKISIVHSVSRKYETALKVCLKTCEDNAVKIEDVFSVNDKNLLEQVSKTDSELVLVIGGDGTMISTIRKLLILNIPFLGINIGKLGFLTDINLESISDELPKVFNAEYVREKRPFLEITLSNKDKKTARLL